MLVPRILWLQQSSALLCISVVHAQNSSSLKAALARQMLGPHSSYSARVLHRDANSGIIPSTLPPNHTAYRCMACDATCTSTAFPPGACAGGTAVLKGWPCQRGVSSCCYIASLNLALSRACVNTPTE